MTRLSRLRCAVALHLWSHLFTWRWLCVAPAFALGAIVTADNLTVHDQNMGTRSRYDAWDLFPALLRHNLLVHFAVGLGFVLLVGDGHLRDRSRGTVTLALMRMPSRWIYWIGHMAAVGLLALFFSLSALAVVLFVGAVVAPPSSGVPMWLRDPPVLLYPPWRLALPVYDLLVALYTAWALWVLGCATVLLSMFVRRRVLTLLVVAAWATVSADHSAFHGSGLGRMLYMGCFIGYSKHLGYDSIPLWAFFAVTAVMLAVVAVSGSWKMRREEL